MIANINVEVLFWFLESAYIYNIFIVQLNRYQGVGDRSC